jgi:hypothetical protein
VNTTTLGETTEECIKGEQPMKKLRIIIVPLCLIILFGCSNNLISENSKKEYSQAERFITDKGYLITSNEGIVSEYLLDKKLLGEIEEFIKKTTKELMEQNSYSIPKTISLSIPEDNQYLFSVRYTIETEVKRIWLNYCDDINTNKQRHIAPINKDMKNIK